MQTLVISDTHLGSRRPVDILRRPEPLAALCDAASKVDRLVLLGDLFELRQGPLRDVLKIAQPVIEEIGRAVMAILTLPSMTGQMIVLDGGQHLVWQTPDIMNVNE